METLLEKDFSHFLTGSYAFGHEELLIGDLMKENFMGHRTKRILRIERKEYQTY